MLAHLSGDAALVRLLQQAGPAGDAFKHIAHSWLGAGQGGSLGGGIGWLGKLAVPGTCLDTFFLPPAMRATAAAFFIPGLINWRLFDIAY